MNKLTMQDLYRTIEYQWKKQEKKEPEGTTTRSFDTFTFMDGVSQITTLEGVADTIKTRIKTAATITQKTEAKDDPNTYVYKT